MIQARIKQAFSEFSGAQQRVGRLIVDHPSAVAFGTVAEVAEEAGTSPQTVLRLANRLGFAGFGDLQDQVRAELVHQLRPAADRIREPAPGDVLAETLAAAVANVQTTLDGLDRTAFRATVDLVTNTRRSVAVLAADAWTGLSQVLVAQLALLRDGVAVVDGSEVRVSRTVAALHRGDVLVAIDVSRYEQWVLASAEQAAAAGVTVIAITDSELSPLRDVARHVLVVASDGPGPFEGSAGVAALIDALLSAAAAKLRPSATSRLDRVEQAWSDRHVFVDDANA